MKTLFRSTCLVLLAIMLLAFPVIVQAAGNSRLELSVHPAKVQVGETFTMEVRVKNAPSIYGADVSLSFDPQVLEVVDADSNQAGIKITPGAFIDPARSFILRHVVDGQQGKIHYALALLNPAPEAKGNGTLLTITFRAKASGVTTIAIVSGMFGTKAGETITPDLDSVKINISTSKGNNNQPNSSKMEIVGISGMGLAVSGLAGYWFWRRRTKKGGKVI